MKNKIQVTMKIKIKIKGIRNSGLNAKGLTPLSGELET
jgi:hypothetical protein